MATNKKACITYVDKELEDAIYSMRKYEEYQRLTKSEIVKRLLIAGLNASNKESSNPPQ